MNIPLTLGENVSIQLANGAVHTGVLRRVERDYVVVDGTQLAAGQIVAFTVGYAGIFLTIPDSDRRYSMKDEINNYGLKGDVVDQGYIDLTLLDGSRFYGQVCESGDDFLRFDDQNKVHRYVPHSAIQSFSLYETADELNAAPAV